MSVNPILPTSVVPSCVNATSNTSTCVSAGSPSNSACITPVEVTQPAPAVLSSFVSDEATATLVGFSEFNGQASTPPKKYLRLSSQGSTTICYRLGLSCVAGFTTIDSYSFDVADVVYNPLTGIPNTVPLYHWVKSSAVCAFHQDGGALPAGNVTQRTALSQTGYSITITPTVYTRVGLGTCVTASPNHYELHGTTIQTLSDEDTEDDAIARATFTPGTSNIAARESRGAGDFSLFIRLVTVSFSCSNLTIGRTYRISVPLTTEDYGGGNAVNSTQVVEFLATATTYTDDLLIEAASGKQVTIGTPTIAVV